MTLRGEDRPAVVRCRLRGLSKVSALTVAPVFAVFSTIAGFGLLVKGSPVGLFLLAFGAFLVWYLWSTPAWVELDGQTIRSKALLRKRCKAWAVRDAEGVSANGYSAGGKIGPVLSAGAPKVAEYTIRFTGGGEIRLNYADMTNVREFVSALHSLRPDLFEERAGD